MTPIITAALLAAFAPRCDAAGIAPHLNSAFRRFGIDTPREVRHAMAIADVESMGFTRLVENLNYSEAGLLKTFGRHRISAADCAKFGRRPGRSANQNAVANIIYGGEYGRRNLGNIAPGDGWRFRGGGWGQNTGRRNYERASAYCGRDLTIEPEFLRTYEGASLAFGGFWHENGLSDIVAEDPGERLLANLEQSLKANEGDDVLAARHVWNGGTNGLAEVNHALVRACRVWKV